MQSAGCRNGQDGAWLVLAACLGLIGANSVFYVFFPDFSLFVSFYAGNRFGSERPYQARRRAPLRLNLWWFSCLLGSAFLAFSCAVFGIYRSTRRIS